MRKYIKAELYRSFNRAYYRNTILIISLVCIMVWFMLSTNAEFGFTFEIGKNLLNIPIYLLLIFTTIVTGEDIKDRTIKNTVGLGLSRDKIVVGKIISSTILAFIAAIIILAVYFVSARIFLTGPGDFPVGLAKDFFLRLLAVIPIWIGGIAIGTFSGILASSEGLGVLIYIMVISIIPNMLEMVGMMLEINSLSWIKANFGVLEVIKNIIDSPSLLLGLKRGLVVGIVYLILFTGLSILLFRRKDL